MSANPVNPSYETPPSIGRIVHYVSRGSADGVYPSVCRAAVVTEVTEHPDADGTVSLAVLNPEGMFFNRGVHHAEDVATGAAAAHPPGTWHWPERIEDRPKKLDWSSGVA